MISDASMDVIITGATGMVGKGVLLECLDSPQVQSVTVVSRHSLGMAHKKLKEILLPDFGDLTPLKSKLANYHACFFCMGVSALGLSESQYRDITYHITLNFAALFAQSNPGMTFCYVSGAGTNVRGRSMWARVKGETERDLQKLPFKEVFLFRPGFIQPLKGIKSKTKWYNLAYAVLGPLYGLFKKLTPNAVTDTTRVGKAMINAALQGYEKQFLNNRDINILSERASNSSGGGL